MEGGKLFIGGISWETSEERLRVYFEAFGEVVEAVIMKDRTTGRARGFGFIVYADAFVAEKVVRERHIIDGRTVEAKKAVPRDDHQNFTRTNSSIHFSPTPPRTKKIFVGGLASTVTENDFKRYFDQFGTITDVVVMYDHNTQRPRGFGFITYDSEEAVDRVLFKTFHELNGKMVEVKRAVPKELSPGPSRSPSYNHGLNRMGSFLNAYNHSMRMDDRFSPVTVGRSGLGLNFDSGLGLNYGANGDSGLGYGLGINSYCSGNSSRHGSPVAYASGGNGSLLSTTNRNVWGGENPNYGTKSLIENDFIGSGNGNAGIFGGFGNVGGISGRSAVSAEGWGDGSLRSENIIYGIGASNFLGRTGYIRNNGSGGGSTSLYSITSNVRDSFYGDHDWHSSSLDIDRSALFGYGRESAVADVAANNPVGYIGDYSVTARSNRGIAA